MCSAVLVVQGTASNANFELQTGSSNPMNGETRVASERVNERGGQEGEGQGRAGRAFSSRWQWCGCDGEREIIGACTSREWLVGGNDLQLRPHCVSAGVDVGANAAPFCADVDKASTHLCHMTPPIASMVSS